MLEVQLSRPTVPRRSIPPVNLVWDGIPAVNRERFLHPGELEVLAGLISTINDTIRMVEFGCQNGRTARVLLDSLPQIKSYIGIDVELGYVPAKAVQRNEVPEIPGHFARGDARFLLLVRPNGSYDVKPNMLKPVNVAFIDGDHSRNGILNDYSLAKESMPDGGLIIFHDDHNLGTVDVKEVLDELHYSGQHIDHIEGTWIAYTVI